MTTPLTRSQRAEIQALAEKATPGPWFVVGSPWGDGSWIRSLNEDPHADGVPIADFEMLDEHFEDTEENPPRIEEDAAFCAAARTAIPAYEAALAAAEQASDMALGPHCTGCGNAIDPEWCWCGDGPESKHFDETHGFIPMGCDCARADRDWKKLATSRGETLWTTEKDRADLAAKLAAMTAARDEACDIADRLEEEFRIGENEERIAALRAVGKEP